MFLRVKNNVARITLGILVLLIFSVSLALPVAAEEGRGDPGGVTRDEPIGICTFIGPICEAIGISDDDTSTSGKSALNFTTSRASQIVSLIFIGIIIIAIFIIVRAGVQYIQSQGQEEKIADAQKAIKSVFIGIAVLFVGIVGLILVLAFFRGTSLIGGENSLQDIFRTTGT